MCEGVGILCSAARFLRFFGGSCAVVSQGVMFGLHVLGLVSMAWGEGGALGVHHLALRAYSMGPEFWVKRLGRGFVFQDFRASGQGPRAECDGHERCSWKFPEHGFSFLLSLSRNWLNYEFYPRKPRCNCI